MTPRTCAALLAVAIALALAFGSPAKAATYVVPATIPADCSTTVEGQLMSWLATVPDGNMANLNGGCYGIDKSLIIQDRNNLTVEGNGAEIRALTPGTSHRANVRLVHGSNLVVRNLAVRGRNQAHGWWGAPGSTGEWQHGFSVEGVYGLTLAGVSATEVWGDGITLLGRGGYCQPDASRNVSIQGATTTWTGRNGVSFVHASDSQLVDSRITKNLGLALVDIEPDDPCWYVKNIVITRNVFDGRKNKAVKYYGLGTISNVQVYGNTYVRR